MEHWTYSKNCIFSLTTYFKEIQIQLYVWKTDNMPTLIPDIYRSELIHAHHNLEFIYIFAIVGKSTRNFFYGKFASISNEIVFIEINFSDHNEWFKNKFTTTPNPNPEISEPATDTQQPHNVMFLFFCLAQFARLPNDSHKNTLTYKRENFRFYSQKWTPHAIFFLWI